MNTIINYLDNLFAGYPKSEEILRAKQELKDNMEDRYHELKKQGKSENEAIGIVISEFGNIDEIAQEWSSTTDDKDHKEALSLNQEDVEKYESDKKAESILVSAGVAIIMIGIMLLILIGNFMPGQHIGRLDFTEPQTLEGIGSIFMLAPLFVAICISVVLFIMADHKVEGYEEYTRKEIILPVFLREKLKEKKNKYQTNFTIGLITGVILCIMSPFTLLCIIAIAGESDRVSSVAVCIFLSMITIACFIFITGGEKMSALNVLLQEGDYEKKNIKKNKTMDLVGGIFWPVVTAGYLFYSLVTNRWDISWVVWPVAGVLYGAIAGIVAVIKKEPSED